MSLDITKFTYSAGRVPNIGKRKWGQKKAEKSRETNSVLYTVVENTSFYDPGVTCFIWGYFKMYATHIIITKLRLKVIFKLVFLQYTIINKNKKWLSFGKVSFTLLRLVG